MSLRVSFISRFEYLLYRAPGNRWIKAGTLLTLTALIYHSVIFQFYLSWFNNPYYNHGFLIPLLSVYLIFKNRKKLNDIEISPSLYGLIVSFLGIFLFFLDKYFTIDLFLSSSSLIIFLMGGVLFTFGREHLRVLLLPILFLLFMVPIPDSVIDFLIDPLQLTAAIISEIILQFLRIPVYREGIYLYVAPAIIEVDRSCSAVHSLMALLPLSVIVAYLTADSLKKGTIIVASSIPLAILANGFRIVSIILLVLWQGQEVLNSFFHPNSGKLFFLVALSILVLEASIIKRLGRPFAMNSFANPRAPSDKG